MARPPRTADTADANLLGRTLAAATRDVRTVTDSSEPLHRLTQGVSIRPVATHVDERGTLVEMFDTRWNWHPEPLNFAYSITIRPGIVKGWNLHKEHEDRYFLLQGEMELVMYDPRPDSPTCGEVCRVVLSEHNRCLINVPRFVWHADHNIGTTDVVLVNFPTMQFSHASPDKYRLPLDTDLIPFSFPPDARGW